MKDLKAFYVEFGKIGAHPDLDFYKRKQIQYTNQIALIFSVSCLPYLIVTLVLGYFLASFLIALCIFSFLIVPAINKKGHYDLASITYILLVNFFLLVFTSLFGAKSEIQHVLITVAFLPGAIFFNRRRAIILSLAAMSILIYIALEVFLVDTNGYLNREDNLFFYLFIPFRAASILFPVLHLNSNRRMSERTLLDAKQKLEEAYKLLQNKAQERKIKIQTQNNYIEHILSNLPVLLFATDSKGMLNLVMGKGLNDSGLKDLIKEGIFLKELNDVLPSQVLHGFNNSNTSEIQQAEFLYNGVYFRIAVSNPNQDESDNIIGIIYNIDSEKKSQENLLRLTDILNQSTDYIASLDPDGKPIYFNDSLERLIQRQITEVQSMADLHPEDTLAKIRSTFDISLHSDIWEGESILLDASKNKIPVSQIIIRHRNELNQVIRYSTVMRNISEQKMIQEKMSQYAIELEKTNQDLKHFAYLTSHDLKEPIRNIATHVQLLNKIVQVDQNDKVIEYSNFIVKNAARLSELISSLLRYMNLERLEVESAIPVNVKELINEIRDSHKLLIDEKNAQLEYTGLEFINSNKYYLMILLQNLIENGIKYNKSKQVSIKIHSEETGREVLFRVEDNGIGIPEEAQGGIFLMFKRLHAYEEYEGHGIGLAACKRITDKLQGRIWFESKLEEGSTFYFTLPIK